MLDNIHDLGTPLGYGDKTKAVSPWMFPNENGELPGGSCCRQAAEKARRNGKPDVRYCYMHDPASYSQLEFIDPGDEVAMREKMVARMNKEQIVSRIQEFEKRLEKVTENKPCETCTGDSTALSMLRRRGWQCRFCPECGRKL
jgi:hypothetical protein